MTCTLQNLSNNSCKGHDGAQGSGYLRPSTPLDPHQCPLPPFLSHHSTPLTLTSLSMAHNKNKGKGKAVPRKKKMVQLRPKTLARMTSSAGVIPHLSPPPLSWASLAPPFQPARWSPITQVLLDIVEPSGPSSTRPPVPTPPAVKKPWRQYTTAQYTMQAWPIVHRTHLHLEIMHRAVSELLPEMEAHQYGALVRKTEWATPWGEILQTVVDTVTHRNARPARVDWCYTQALGVVDVGSLLIELSGRIRVHSGCPSCHASQGQNHGVRHGCRGSEEVRQSA